MADSNDPLFLQFKEARASVLEPYVGKSQYNNQGERVVVGQRIMQSASDVFLGWTRDERGHDYYFRQLRDKKLTIDIEAMSKSDWFEYVELCGWALARAHARSGDPAQIAGYLGKSDAFDEAIEKFAVGYADQTERDYEALLKAIRAGRIESEAAARRPRK
jgi:rubrerythrin